MSFFGGLIKGVARIASAVGGAAIKQSPVGKIVGLGKGIVENLKGAKRARLDPSTVPATNQTAALAAKLTAPTPRAMITAYKQPVRRLKVRRAPRASTARAKVEKKLEKYLAPRRASVAPKGGLDLKRIGVMWRGEGKPGKWIDYVKAHSNIRKS